MNLTKEEIDKLSDKLSDEIVKKQRMFQSPVLPLKFAIMYVGKRSETSFRRWCLQWKVYPCATARYARTALDMALNKEAKSKQKAA